MNCEFDPPETEAPVTYFKVSWRSQSTSESINTKTRHKSRSRQESIVTQIHQINMDLWAGPHVINVTTALQCVSFTAGKVIDKKCMVETADIKLTATDFCQ